MDAACISAGRIDCGGADGSLLLNPSEWTRDENGLKQESFAKRAAALIIPIAAKYGASVADTLAVCGAAMTSALKAPDLLTLGPLKVGRLDSFAASPPGFMPADGATAEELASFFTARGMEVDDAVALLGVHSLIATKGCSTGYNGASVNSCNPLGRPTAADPVGPYSRSCPGLQMCVASSSPTVQLRYCMHTCALYCHSAVVAMTRLFARPFIAGTGAQVQL